MAALETSNDPVRLALPRELQDLEGLIRADLDAIARMVTARAHERLHLSRQGFQSLYWDLWNGLASELNQVVAPLSAEWR